jgi:hypothetical protein
MAVTQSNFDTILAAAQGSNVAASGTITIGASNVSEDDTITVNGREYTFKASPSATTDIDIGADNDETASNIQAKLAASTAAAITPAEYSVTDNVVTITYKVAGTVGNAFTLAKSGSEITLSGATLASGVDTGATDYSVIENAGGEVAELRQDSDFEKNILSVIALAEACITLGANPATSSTTALQARRQRRTLKQVCQILASVVPAVADSSADDRTAVATRIREEVLKRYNNINQPTGGL